MSDHEKGRGGNYLNPRARAFLVTEETALPKEGTVDIVITTKMA